MTEQQVPLGGRPRRLKFAVGGAVVAVTILGLISWAMGRPGSTSFYMTVAELEAEGPSGVPGVYRVNGNVVPGSLEQRGIETSFAISDGAGRLDITTRQPLPDAFSTAYENDPEAVEVVAEGRYDGQKLTATTVLAKCPSKFKTQA